jgi:hypothetical protein
MVNIMQKLNCYLKKNIILIVSFLMILQPVIDVIIGLSKYANILTSLTSLLRIIILLFFLYYFIFVGKIRDRKKVYCLFSIVALYLLFFFVNMNYSFLELKSALRTFYFPLILLSFYCIKEEQKTFIDRKYLFISLGIYAFVIIFGFITNTAFNSYEVAKVGTSGYFYAANEIGNIIAILLPLLFSFVFNKINWKKIVFFALIIIVIFILGTKTPFISLLICFIYYYIKKFNYKNIIKLLILPLVAIIFLFIIIPLTPIYKNTLIHASFLKLNNISQIIKNPSLFDHFVLGSRLKFLKENTNIYLHSDINDQLLGIGYLHNTKESEMDFNDILYRQGIIGFIVYFGVVINILLSNKNTKRDWLLIILILLITTIVGHVITAPSVGTFVASLLLLSKKEVKE